MRNKLASKKADATNGTVTFAIADEGQPIVAALTALPQAIVNQLALHGLSQKCGDSYAGAETPAEARAAVSAVLADLTAGNWNAARAGGAVKVLVVVEALARVSGESVEDAQSVYGDLSDEDKEKLRKHPGVKAAMAAINAERAAARAQALASKAEGSEKLDLASL